MEFKGTKEEWNLSIDYDDIVETKDIIVCQVFQCNSDEHKANAQLISASPELLEALQNNQLMISKLSNISGGRGIAKSMLMKQFLENETAINKALGQ